MNTLPLQLKLKQVLLVGKGEPAKAKQRLLTEMGAKLLWWQQPPTTNEMDQLTLNQANSDTRLSLVVVAGHSAWCQDIAQWARDQRLLLNQVDAPEVSDVFFPAIVKRGPLRIGIGSGGINPVLTRLIRQHIELALPTRLSQLVALVQRWHSRVRDALPDFHQRRLFWESNLFGPLSEGLSDPAKSPLEQEALMDASIQHTQKQGRPPGFVGLVSAGPGGPGLLTTDALRILTSADIVLHDKLVSTEVLNLARRDARILSVGKRVGENNQPMEAICQRMAYWARQGKIVCRLHGGDALIFGRCGEEIALLTRADVPFRIIPGVTSASAMAAGLNIPLTHRDKAHGLRMLTGHRALEDMPNRGNDTLVIYMGYSQLPHITARLLAQGESPHLPLALVQNVGLPNQTKRLSTLAQAQRLAQSFSLSQGPILIIIGEVVNLPHYVPEYTPITTPVPLPITQTALHAL